MRITPVQNAFTAGEISPRLRARFDMDAYYAGATQVKNFLCLPHGPLLRRGGTTFIEEAASLSVRLIPFRFSASQSLVIELGDHYARFYFRGGIVTSDGVNPYVLTTPWSADQIWDLDYAQYSDVLYVVHPNVQPQKFKRLANNNWTINPVSFTDRPSQWGGTNWPSHLVFFEQRLFYAATPNEPQTIWASRTGLYDEFTKKGSDDKVADDMAIEYTIASDEVNGVQWMQATNVLVVGTSGAEYKISAGSVLESITPTNIRILKQTAYGSMDTRAYQVGSGIAFAQRSGTRVRMFEYSYAEDQYVASDITIMSEHILAGRIKVMALQTVPDTYVWCVLQNGELVALTYDKAQKVNAWHRHVLGGNGKVRAIAVVPGAVSDEVWLAVERTINGRTKLYIEAFIDSFSEVDTPDSGYFMDSHLYYEGDLAISQVGGLDHLEGCEVAINVDGWVHPNVTVENGSVRLSATGKRIVVGLPYDSYFESCPVQSSDNVIMGNLKRIYSADISVLKTLGLYIGVVGYKEQEVYMGPTHIMNKAQDLYTGTLQLKIPSSTDTETQLYIRHDKPLPCEIRAIKYSLEVNQ